MTDKTIISGRYGPQLEYKTDKCPEFGTPEHYKLGGGRGPFYEPMRRIEHLLNVNPKNGDGK